MAARIDRLWPAARELLRAVAVAGLSVDRETLTAMLDGDAEALLSALDDVGEFLVVGPTAVRFRQAVIRDVAYEGLAFRRRTVLHGRLADLLSQRPADGPDHLAVLSLHCLRAGRHREALTMARAAADRAAQAHAHAEAALLYRRALTAGERLPDVPARERGELLERLGDSQWQLGEYSASDACFSAAVRLQPGDASVAARTGLKRARSAERRGAYPLALSRLEQVRRAVSADPANLDRLGHEARLRVATTRFRQGRLAAARAGLHRVVQEADAQRDPAVLADALALLDVVERHLGLPVDGSRARLALHLYDRIGDLGGQARTHTQIGYGVYLDGRWPEAAAAYRQARELSERIGDLPQAAVNDANLAEILIDQDRLDEAETTLRHAVRVWRASAADNDVAFGEALLGRVLAKQGRCDEAADLLAAARGRFLAQDAKSEVVDADAYLAECLLVAGKPAESLALAEATMRAASRLSRHPVREPLLLRVVGACQDALGRRDAADLAYGRALDAARRSGAEHDVAFTVAAMCARHRPQDEPVAPALVDLARTIQLRLGLVLTLAPAEERRTIRLPEQRPQWQPATSDDDVRVVAAGDGDNLLHTLGQGH